MFPFTFRQWLIWAFVSFLLHFTSTSRQRGGSPYLGLWFFVMVIHCRYNQWNWSKILFFSWYSCDLGYFWPPRWVSMTMTPAKPATTQAAYANLSRKITARLVGQFAGHSHPPFTETRTWARLRHDPRVNLRLCLDPTSREWTLGRE